MRATVLRCLAAGGLVLSLVLVAPGIGSALPPPPSNPSDSDLGAGQAAVKDKTALVGDLTNQLAAADAKLSDLSDQVEQKMEQVNKAMVDLQTAQDAAKQAKDAADAAKLEADAAGIAVDDARHRLDDFAAASYQQGSLVGSEATLIDATSPDNLLERAQLLDALSSSELHAMDGVQRADVDKANLESASRKSSQAAEQKQDAAAAAKKQVDAVMADAVAARKSQAARTAQLQSAKSDIESQLSAAQDKVNGLQAQRQQYQAWQAQRQHEEAAAAHQNSGASVPQQRPSISAPGRASIVIDRAMSELGVTYAWGGGTASGPSRGVSDGGGDADYYGDYDKIGFDCSGLMVYAFAGAGVYLPHYSGYQYYAGQHIPLSQMRPGDMLFYGDPSDIHHVTLYVGGGQMIEAPYSGAVVRLVPVRWDEIMPYATRVL